MWTWMQEEQRETSADITKEHKSISKNETNMVVWPFYKNGIWVQSTLKKEEIFGCPLGLEPDSSKFGFGSKTC